MVPLVSFCGDDVVIGPVDAVFGAAQQPGFAARASVAHPAHVVHAGVGSGEPWHHVRNRQDE